MTELPHLYGEGLNYGHQEQEEIDEIFEQNVPPDEESPLLFNRHLSMEQHEKKNLRNSLYQKLFFAMVLVPWVFFCFSYTPIPIEEAQEGMLDIGGGVSLWYRTWGNRRSGVPVLFVHGGPGNAIEDYHNGNKKIFDRNKFFVIEMDQRGTGKSLPSVRVDSKNMEYYKDISIEQMSNDFEKVREELDIDRWLVFGGSWGSTLSLDYGMRFPDSCIAIILRGVFLNSKSEYADTYFQSSHEGSKRQLEHFTTWYNVAAEYAKNMGEAPLQPNDESGRILRIYERMIQQGDPKAIWNWMAFENNLIEDDSSKYLDPHTIDKHVMPEAQSVAFFETHLFNQGAFEAPLNLLEKVNKLKGLHTWVCQGSRDKVCPSRYAHALVDAFKASDVEYTARFIDSGHLQSEPIMEKCLQNSLDDFLNTYN